MNAVDEWLPIRRAAFVLVREGYTGCSYSNLARLARSGKIESRDDPLNERVKLIHVPTLRTKLRRES